MPLPTLPPFHVNEEKSAPAITQYTEKNTHQNDESNPDENTEKSHLKNNETTYAGRENKPPISPKGILAVQSVIRGKVYAPIRGKIRRDLTGGISGKGKRGIATFSVEIQAIVFIPRNVPIHPFGQPSGHPGKRPCPFSGTGHRRREKAGGFQGNGGNPAIRTEKRLAAGRETGTSRFRARGGCGSMPFPHSPEECGNW